MKIEVIFGEPQELAAAVREWLGQHARARIQGTQATSCADANGKVTVTVLIFYQE